MIIDGKKIANDLLKNLKNKNITSKFFGALIVGEDKSSLNFLKIKQKIAKELNIDFRIYKFNENITTDKLRHEIARLANPKNCGGFTVQLPLPKHINSYYVLNSIPKNKDVDLLSEHSIGAFYSGRHKLKPPSVKVVEEIVKNQNINISNLNCAVIGYGYLIGKPISFWLLDKVKQISVFTDKNINFQNNLKNYDIIISGVGKAKLFSAKHLKQNTVVIDFGYDFDKNNKIYGDFDSDLAKEKDILYTPTPGGTGPILVAKLFENFLELNQ
ncbi:MAG: bifunctional 5,10-methylenetetrahydrofolate dehydrogenase/5,10-methenyltetrahydrofolate cyclohydrolase [Patescibacteria group bacterium]|nr:bifunctional 5,10-methylenetetrahydrofolate dehydrogenase/5,10-methenyltetrahydrofolate cyclohydrolase [Patescibacteria group bacterium]